MAINYFRKKALKKYSKKVIFEGKQCAAIIHSFEAKKHREASSFGFQWQRYNKIQIDSLNKTKISEQHLKQMLGKQLNHLKDKVVLEVGSGAGRYTDVLRKYAKHVITVDASDAIFANVCLGAKNVLAVQSDLFSIPVRRENIDIVFCRGVIQHTNDPKLAIRTLKEYAKKGGVIIFDVYPKNWQSYFYTKYYLRPFTKRIDKKKAAMFLEKNIPKLLWFKAKIFNKLFPNIRFIRDIPDVLIPIADYTRRLPGLTWEQYVSWCVLDTFDMYTPEYDTPLSFNEIITAASSKDTKIAYADKDQFQFRVKRVT